MTVLIPRLRPLLNNPSLRAVLHAIHQLSEIFPSPTFSRPLSPLSIIKGLLLHGAHHFTTHPTPLLARHSLPALQPSRPFISITISFLNLQFLHPYCGVCLAPVLEIKETDNISTFPLATIRDPLPHRLPTHNLLV